MTTQFFTIKHSFVNRSALHILILLIFLLSLTVFTGCATNKTVVTLYPQPTDNPLNKPVYTLTVAQKIQADAFSQMGLPYRYGGMSPQTGFDCTGLTCWTHSNYGFKLPRNTRSQLNGGIKVEKKDIKPGDVVFYRERRGLHAGLYIGNGQFIHSPHTGDVIKISRAFDKYHAARFAGARRYHNDPDPKALPEELRKEIMAKAMAGSKMFALSKAKTKKLKAANAPKTSSQAYRIKKGDTISAVAHRFKVSQEKLLQANKLRKTSTLRIGQKLTIPGTAVSVKPKAAGNPKPSKKVYKVKKGDTIYSLARRFNISQKTLLQVNQLRKAATLSIGQKLTIPES